MRKKTQRLLSLMLGLSLTATTLAVAGPSTVQAADGKEINIDFSQTDGEMIPKTGWLLIPNENIPDGRIIPLNTKDVRDDFDTQNLLGNHAGSNDESHLEDVLPNERNRFQRAKHGKEHLDELGVDNYYPIIAYMPSWVSANGKPQSPPQNYDVWKQWTKDIVQYMKDNDMGVNEFNVYNENWSISVDNFNHMYEQSWWAGKEVMPESKMIGPSPSSDNAGVIQSLADYCEQVGIPLDIVSWHFGNYNNLPNFQQGLEDYISQKPTLGNPKYYYEEYTSPGDVSNLGVEFTIFANFDRADVDAAIRGIWSYANGLSDMLVTDQNADNPYARRDIWWLMTAYGSMSGTRVKQSGDDLYIASYDEAKGEAKILIGNQTGDVTLNLDNFPFAGENVRVEKYKIADSEAEFVENDGLKYQNSDPAATAGTTVSTNINFENKGDVWMIVVKEEESIPSDFALMGPDDGMTAGLQPEFSWQVSQGAASYDFVISKNKDMSSPVEEQKGLTENKCTLKTKLEEGTTYYWTVTAKNDYGTREAYNGMYYTLYANDNLNVPGPFTMLQVIDEDYGTELQPKISWTKPRDGKTYNIYISKNSDFTDAQEIEVTDPKSHSIGQGNEYWYYVLSEDEALEPETHYYAKVEAVNENGTRMMNDTAHEFTTTTADGKPAEFNAAAPGNGETFEPRSTLRWEPSLGSFFYRLEVATDKEFENVVLQRDTITVPAYTMEEDILEPETTYYWRVTAVTKDGSQETECSNGVQSFITSKNPTPPIVKSAYSAPGGAVVSFDSVQEADSYIVKYGTSAGNYTESVETNDTMTYIPLDEDGTYYFSVAAVCNDVEGKTYNEVSAQKGNREPDEIVLGETIEFESADKLEKTELTAGAGMSANLAVEFNEVGSKAEFTPMVESDKIHLTYRADQDASVGVYVNGDKVTDAALNQTDGKYKTIDLAVSCKDGDTLSFQKDTKETGFILDCMVLSNGEKLENLALNKPVTADSAGQTYTADKAVDGKIAGNMDFWIGGKDPTEDAPNWLDVDLGDKARIHSIEVALPDAAIWTERTQDIQIMTSLDGKEYTERAARKEYTFIPGDEGNNNKYTITFDEPVEATHVKVQIYSNTEGKVGQIGELYVMGVWAEPSVSDNLALGKTVTTKASLSGNFPASNITDGDVTTFWDGGGENFPNYATVDLERPYHLSKLEIALPNIAAWTPRGQEMEIQTSMDGKEFVTVVEKRKYDFNNENNGNQVVIELKDEVTARYVRVVGYSNDEPSKPGQQISELRVFGSFTPVESVVIDQEDMEIPLGASAQLTAAILPDEAEFRDVAWSSSDVTVASVDANGVVTAKAKGTAEIRARSLDNAACTDKITVTVGDVALDRIELTPPAKVKYKVGEKLDLTGMKVTAYYSDGTNKDVTQNADVSGYDKNTAGEQTITVSYKGKEASFTVTVTAELTGIKVTPPDNVEYQVGEELDLTGMKVMAQYSDGTEADVTKDAKVTGYDKNTVGEQTVTVTYEGKEAVFTVTVTVQITGIKVTPPAKVEYKVGEKLDLTGMKVMAQYSDGTERDVTDHVKVSGYDKNTAGVQTIKVSYKGQEETFSVNVTGELTGIKVTPPAKVDYKVGEELDLTGMKVIAQYSDGTEIDVTKDAEVIGYDKNSAGEQTITVIFGDKEAAFKVNVTAELIGLKVTPPAKIEYKVGEKLDLTGMKVMAQYSDGSEIDVTQKAKVSGYDKNTAGEQKIMVSYKGKETSFTVTVIAELIGIKVTPPEKVDYNVGEELDLTGMKVMAQYSDGNEIDVTEKAEVTGYAKNTVGEQTITVTYEGQDAVFKVRVTAELTGIKVTPPAKVEYKIGEKLDLTGMKVMAQYSDGTETDVTQKVKVSGYDKNTAGEQTITVSYKGQEATFVVTVEKAEVGAPNAPTDPSQPDNENGGSNQAAPTTGDTNQPVLAMIGLLILSFVTIILVLKRRIK